MKKYNIYVIAAGIFAATGCTPLQQAPLVYSSKVSVGADVSATMTEQPGVSVSLGYKQVDAAYVPVAVAKQCDKEKGAAVCEHEMYKIISIVAYNNANDSKLPERSIGEAKKHVDELLTLLKAKEAASIALEERKKYIDDAKKELNAIEKSSLFATAQTNAKNGDSLTVEDENVLERHQRYTSRAGQDTKAAASDLAVKSAQLEQFVAKPEIANLAAHIKLLSGSNAKQDAYSVFGSFDGKTTAGGGITTKEPTAEASLIIGKVFSTGVASQNLTEGMKSFYQGKGASTCLHQAETYITNFSALINAKSDEGKKSLADFHMKILDMCSKALDIQKSNNSTT